VLDSLHSFLAWCIGAGLLEVNVATGVNRNDEVKRERFLSDLELAKVWHGVEGLNPDFRDAVRLLTLTGCRKAEINELRWSEVKIGTATIEISGARTKNRHTHIVPLSKPAVDILDNRPRASALVFGRSGTGYGNWAPAKDKLDEVMRRNGWNGEDWTIHDIRRTVATGLQKLHIPQEVTEAVLNHKSGKVSGIAAVYARHDFADEKRAALELWGQHVMGLAE
jgi:integrase